MMARHLNSLLWLEEMYSDDDDDHQSCEITANANVGDDIVHNAINSAQA